ncbi:MAG: hypothetical protein EAY75_09780 [Bacteroidetes bacterium]|nr:MAG: hypothetical protein EAY75_09780 [Bacteroidota bacterium]
MNIASSSAFHLGQSGRSIFKYMLCVVFTCFWLLPSGRAQTAERLSLNGTWSFRIDPYGTGEKLNWFFKDLDASNWDSMPVPGNWDLVNEYATYAGDAWYSKRFKIDKSNAAQQFRLIFQSVYNDSKVWVNGQFVGENHLGFLPFQFDITRHIKFDQENRVTVLVNNIFKRGALWNWGGIRRPVTLEITDPARLEFQHISAIPDLKKGDAKISTKVVCSNLGAAPKNVRIGIKIKRDGKLVVEDFVQAAIPANSNRHTVNWMHSLAKSKVALWHFDYPVLYESEITLYDGNQLLHTITDRFGIRKLEIDGIKILLNGESIRPVGFNIVPEDRFTGNTLPFARIKEDVDLMKSMGITMARLSHVSLPKEYLDYLDEKGIMVFEEVGLWGKDNLVDPDHPLPKEWLKRIVEEKYNHPCIIGWSVGNEIGAEKNNPKAKAYIKGAIEMAKQLDSNRFSVYVSNTGQNNPNDAMMFADISMINLYGGWGKWTDLAWTHHKKPVFVAEFGKELNSEDPNLGTVPIEKMMNEMRNKEYVFGASLWTMNDYRSKYHGNPGWVTPPSQNRPWGIVTTFRDNKRSFYATQREYAPVKALIFSAIDLSQASTTISIEPRSKFDIPANMLRGYSLRLSIVGKQFDTTEVRTIALKDISPGDATFGVKVDWKSKVDISLLHVALVDPQGYAVLHETKYFSAPSQPAIRFANTANTKIRIHFNHLPNATEYMIRYKNGDSVFTTARTINQFIDIEDERLKQGVEWSFQLIALNDAGESSPSKAWLLLKDEDELPPHIWGQKRIGDDVFISYSVDPFDYLYEVEYGTQSGVYTQKFATKLVGVLRVQSPEKEKPLYFRMRVIKQWGFASEWTEECKVK